MTTTELREQLTAERDTLHTQERRLRFRLDEAEAKFKETRNEWYPVWVRMSDTEKQLAALDALAGQLEQKSPGSETGATENTTAQTS